MAAGGGGGGGGGTACGQPGNVVLLPVAVRASLSPGVKQACASLCTRPICFVRTSSTSPARLAHARLLTHASPAGTVMSRPAPANANGKKYHIITFGWWVPPAGCRAGHNAGRHACLVRGLTTPALHLLPSCLVALLLLPPTPSLAPLSLPATNRVQPDEQRRQRAHGRQPGVAGV